MDLIGAIVDRFNNSPDTEVAALQALTGSGKMSAELAGTKARPYIVVDDLKFDPEYQAIGSASGYVASQTVQFSIYADTRNDCIAILEALENAYSSEKLISLGWPDTDDKKTLRERDCWRGVLNLHYWIQK